MQHWDLKLNWCEIHIIETCFPDLFLSDELTFYLDNPVDARWVKSKQNYTCNNKGIKIRAWTAISSRRKHNCICMNKIWIPKIILKYLERLWRKERSQRYFKRWLIS